jgi:hypothetical protein
MYYNLTGALKRRLVLEFKDAFSRHPVFEKATPYIQSKYAFQERPTFGMIVKGSGGNQMQLSADNYIGTIVSHVMLAYYGEPTHPLEWVREDLSAIRANDDIFPSVPGVYYIEVLNAPTNVTEPGQFVIDPLLTITQEYVSVSNRTAQLKNKPVKGTVRLYENAYYMLTQERDYTIDTEGKITFPPGFEPKEGVFASYRTAAPSSDPIDFYWNQPNMTAIPGAILAFGKRARLGDKVAVVVSQDRRDTALAYGGKFAMSFDIDIIASDPTQAEEMSDFACMSLLLKKSNFESEGIELVEITPGGEVEEQRDETGDLYSYNVPLSVQLRADWEAHIPLALTISKVSTSLNGVSSTQMVHPNLMGATPILVGRNNDFERIG